MRRALALPFLAPLLLALPFLIPLPDGTLTSAPAKAQDAQVQQAGEEEEQGVLANVLSRLLTTPTTRISIGGIEGALSTNAVIRDIAISDAEGVWLSLERADLDWSFTALLRGRLQVSELALTNLAIDRLPLPTERPEAVAEGPLLPELPVELVVERFALDRLTLGEAVLGTAAQLSAEGSAELVSAEEGLRLDFQAQRLDAPGVLAVDLRYAPETNALALNLVHDEPEGGIVARMLDLPGLPPVRLRVAGDAPLDAFVAELDFEAGPAIGAQGAATVGRSADAYRLDLDVEARIAGLLPEALAPVFEGTTQLEGAAAIVDDGSLQLEALRVTSPAAQIALDGGISADRALDLRLTGATTPTAEGMTQVGQAEIEKLDLDLTLGGSLAAPRIAGRVEGAGLRHPRGVVATVTAQLDVSPDPSEPGNDETMIEPLRFSVDAEASGVAPADPALAAALGDAVRIAARGTAEPGSLLRLDEASIATPTMDASYAGSIARRNTEGVLDAAIPDLAPFSELAGLDLAGAADLSAEITGDPLVDDIAADLRGELTGFATGNEALDGLFGPQVDLTGVARSRRDGFGFEALHLAGANLEVTVDGAASSEASDLGLNAVIPDLGALHDRVDAGRALVEARLTGPLANPDAVATVSVEDAVAMERPVPRMTARLEAREIAEAPDVSLTLDGDVGPHRAEGGFRLRSTEEGYALEPLDIRIGSVSLSGRLVVGPALLTEGEVSAQADDLDDLSPLVLQRLGGGFEATARLSVRDGEQDAAIDARGAQISVEEISLSDFTLEANGVDLLGQPRIDGMAEASALNFAGQTFTDIRLSAEGTAEATDFSLTAVGDGAIFETDGRLMPGEPGDPLPRLDLENFSVRAASP